MLNAIGLTLGDNSTVNIYTKTIRRRTQLKTLENNTINNLHLVAKYDVL